MDEARALLNSLMGSDRNVAPEKRRKRSFTDSDICKSYLLGLCPHELFTNTKIDLGPCPKEHNDLFREQFEEDAEGSNLRRKWRTGLRNELNRLLQELERRMDLNRQRIAREKQVEPTLTEEQRNQLNTLKEEMSDLLKKAEQAADEGKFEESKVFVKETDALKRKIEDLELRRYEKYRKEEICEVCGLIVDSEEAEAIKAGRGWHENGRQHTGYRMIREKLKEIEQEEAEDRKGGREGARDEKERERDRPREEREAKTRETPRDEASLKKRGRTSPPKDRGSDKDRKQRSRDRDRDRDRGKRSRSRRRQSEEAGKKGAQERRKKSPSPRGRSKKRGRRRSSSSSRSRRPAKRSASSSSSGGKRRR